MHSSAARLAGVAPQRTRSSRAVDPSNLADCIDTVVPVDLVILISPDLSDNSRHPVARSIDRSSIVNSRDRFRLQWVVNATDQHFDVTTGIQLPRT